MTVELVLRFPLGRFHATPWGENHNEGGIEWPPSPWRLLRALYATWRSRAPELDADAVLSLLDELASPPEFVLPRHAASHTRHYLPGPSHKAGVSTDTSKVLDAFVAVDPSDELIVRWETDLDDEARGILSRLAGELTYFGRAESICDAEARFERSSRESPVYRALDPTDPAESVSLLVADRPLDEDALTVTTTQVRSKLRQREPPATTRFRYPRPTPGPEVQARPARTRDTTKVTAVRWSLATNALPSKHAAVAWADTLRLAALSRYGDIRPGIDRSDYPPALSGKSPEGNRNNTQHSHAHWFAFADPGDELLRTIAVWAPAGFNDDVLDALASITWLRRQGISDVHSSRVGVEGWGTAAEVLPELTGPARKWVSYTPFAPTRHRHKRDGNLQGFHVDQVRRELAWRGFDGASAHITTTTPGNGDWHHFRRYRPGRERLRDARSVVGVEVEFDEPVGGPIALGSLSHFGLGLFMPIDT